MSAYPEGGCYNHCYANKISKLYGYDFTQSIVRKFISEDWAHIRNTVNNHNLSFFRIGTMGDPCHDWVFTMEICDWLGKLRTPVVITKHWNPLTDLEIKQLARSGVIINTSISALDSEVERKYRLGQFERLKAHGLRSVLRIVSANFGETMNGKKLRAVQDELFNNYPIIDNPLRLPLNDKRVLSGDIFVDRHKDLGGGSIVSIVNNKTYLGHCKECPDQCGLSFYKNTRRIKMAAIQMELFADKVEFVYVQSVIGSGYEESVAKLAIEDGIAKRAARKNMQIHSAIILLINGEFNGFMTFQNNDICREFCLLQSVIKPDYYNNELYKRMVVEVIRKNINCYPALITTDPKSKFETPALFESLGFETYLKMSGFHYMVHGNLTDIRMKILAHITMTNVWNSVKGDWLRLKREWNERINEAGEKYNISNPLFATREGCWQGENGFSNVVNTKRELDCDDNIITKTKSHNGNASVLDPVACEVILRFFMPKNGKRIYNPFGGGVQFGFIAGANGYEYLASEIRQNQCDANNKLCSDFLGVQWVKSDSSTYAPDGMYDLIFTCPPYYRVEKYIDYDGVIPDGEINSLDSYDKFRDTLFAGYKKAIEHLNDNCFFVVMTGDSRDKKGAYYCSEAETELFFKENGLSVYNKIIYLECEFTRLAHAKKTLNHRKFPKREQKIIIAYKGDISAIKDLYTPVGRL